MLMGSFLEKVVKNIPTTNNNGSIIPNKVQGNLKYIGEKGGQKYSNLVDKIVDLIFKK